LTFSKEN